MIRRRTPNCREKAAREHVIIKCEARTCNSKTDGSISITFYRYFMRLFCGCCVPVSLVLTITAPGAAVAVAAILFPADALAFPHALTFIFPISFAGHCKMTCESLLRSNYLFGPFEGDGCGGDGRAKFRPIRLLLIQNKNIKKYEQ